MDQAELAAIAGRSIASAIETIVHDPVKDDSKPVQPNGATR